MINILRDRIEKGIRNDCQNDHVYCEDAWENSNTDDLHGIGLCWLQSQSPHGNPDAPEGMTYVEFMQDRMDTAKTVEPSRCGWGMMFSLATLGPVYSVVYTAGAINPESTLAKMTAPDSDIPKGVEGAEWYEIPGIWWGVVERLS